MVLFRHQERLKAFEQGKVFRRKGLLLPLLRIQRVIIAKPQQIISGYLIQAANGHQRFMPRCAFILFPAANRVQRYIQLVRKGLLGIAVVFANLLQAFSYHGLITPSKVYAVLLPTIKSNKGIVILVLL